MIRELIQYLHVAENLFGHISTYKGTEMYNTVLHALIESNEVSTLKTGWLIVLYLIAFSLNVVEFIIFRLLVI